MHFIWSSVFIGNLHRFSWPWVFHSAWVSFVAEYANPLYLTVFQSSAYLKPSPGTEIPEKGVWMLSSRPYWENADHALAALQHHLLDGIRDGVQLLDSMRIFLQKTVWDSPVHDHIANFFPDDFRSVAYTYCGSEKQTA